MKSRPLRNAARLFRARKFGGVISLLEPQVFMYRENPHFFYMLGVSCLYTGDYGGAHSYLRRSAQLTEDDTDSLLGLAAIHLKRRENQEALRLWLEVLDRDPKSAIARKGLNLLQRTDDPVMLSEELSDNRIRRLFPTPGFHVPLGVWIALAAAVVASVAYFIAPSVLDRVQAELTARRPGYEVLQVDSKPDRLVAGEGEFRYILTASEIERTYERVAVLFNSFRDNLARREANRLLLSNASERLKERLRLLIDYTSEPDFTSFKDNYEYDEVAVEPWLYEGCYVRWKGRATNVVIGDDVITFDFLVGYHTEQVLEGIVQARLQFAARIEPSESLEVIARIDASRETLALNVTSLRRLSREQQ